MTIPSVRAGFVWTGNAERSGVPSESTTSYMMTLSQCLPSPTMVLRRSQTAEGAIRKRGPGATGLGFGGNAQTLTGGGG